MVPRPSSASWNIAEGALDETITLLTQGEASARTRALLVEARRLRSRIASWRAIPPPPATRREAFESAMHLLRKAGEMPSIPPPKSPTGAPTSSAPPAAPASGVIEAARAASYSPPARAPSSGPPPQVHSATPPPARAISSAPPSGPPLPRKEVIAPGVTVLRPRSMDWRAFRLLEGVDMKVLHRDDDGLYRAIIRLAPGA